MKYFITKSIMLWVIILGMYTQSIAQNVQSGSMKIHIGSSYTLVAPEDVTLTGGTFGTHIGYELLDAVANLECNVDGTNSIDTSSAGEFKFYASQDNDNDCESVIDSFKVLQDSVLDCIKAGFLEEGEVETYANTAWAFVHGIVALAISVPSIDKAQVSKMQAQFEHTFQEGFFKSAQ